MAVENYTPRGRIAIDCIISHSVYIQLTTPFLHVRCYRNSIHKRVIIHSILIFNRKKQYHEQNIQSSYHCYD